MKSLNFKTADPCLHEKVACTREMQRQLRRIEVARRPSLVETTYIPSTPETGKPKVYLSSRSPLRGYYYNKTGRGKIANADRAITGFRWNWYLTHNKRTPLFSSLEDFACQPVTTGLMGSMKTDRSAEMSAAEVRQDENKTCRYRTREREAATDRILEEHTNVVKFVPIDSQRSVSISNVSNESASGHTPELGEDAGGEHRTEHASTEHLRTQVGTALQIVLSSRIISEVETRGSENSGEHIISGSNKGISGGHTKVRTTESTHSGTEPEQEGSPPTMPVTSIRFDPPQTLHSDRMDVTHVFEHATIEFGSHIQGERGHSITGLAIISEARPDERKHMGMEGVVHPTNIAVSHYESQNAPHEIEVGYLSTPEKKKVRLKVAQAGAALPE